MPEKPVAQSQPPMPPAQESALAHVLGRTNVEKLSHAALARQMAAGEGEGARVFGLGRMQQLLQALGNPHLRYRVVHVAGSKGKGSVCELVASGLTHAGVACGLYTSPHVLHLRERFRLGGVCASDAQLEQLAGEVLAAEAFVHANPHAASGPATTFELLTAMALLWFAQRAVDVAVIEVGLGGLLDATNVVQTGLQPLDDAQRVATAHFPGVCILTSIQLEHVELLGGTLEAIAAHKAGIMKRGSFALSAPQEAGVRDVFMQHAARAGATLGFLGEHIAFSHRPETWRVPGAHPEAPPRTTHRVRVAGAGEARCPWPGEHMAINLALALAACAQLREQGLWFDGAACALGMERTQASARLEVVRAAAPRVVIDGAHTPQSMHALLSSLRHVEVFDSLIVVFGCANDKDALAIARELRSAADKIIVTSAQASPRSATTHALLQACAAAQLQSCSQAPTVHAALELASRLATPRDLILATGSFAIAGEAKAWAQSQHA